MEGWIGLGSVYLIRLYYIHTLIKTFYQVGGWLLVELAQWNFATWWYFTVKQPKSSGNWPQRTSWHEKGLPNDSPIFKWTICNKFPGDTVQLITGWYNLPAILYRNKSSYSIYCWSIARVMFVGNVSKFKNVGIWCLKGVGISWRLNKILILFRLISSLVVCFNFISDGKNSLGKLLEAMKFPNVYKVIKINLWLCQGWICNYVAILSR